MFGEPLVGVMVQHFGPEVGVVTGRVAAAPDVVEVGGAVTRRHLRQVDLELLQRAGFEGAHILQRGIGLLRVPGQVKQRGRQVLGGRVALVEAACLEDLVDQLLRHRFAGLVVLGVVGEDLRVQRPVLVELRRELDEIARGGGAGDRRVLHVREHAMQGVAELMEHGGDVVEADQRRLAIGRLGEVADVVDHRLGTGQAVLLDEHVHPGAAGLGVTLEVVGVEQGQRGAVLVEHFVHLHVRVVGRNVGARLEGDAVQLGGGVEDAVLQHVVQFEVRLDLRFVQVVLGLADLLGVEVPIRGGNLEATLLGVDHLLDLTGFGTGLGGGGRHGVGQQLQRRGRGLGHLVAQLVVGEGLEAEQLGLLRTQLRQALHGLAGVVLVATLGTGFRGLQHGGALVTVAQRTEHRLLRGVLQRQHELAIELAILGGVGRVVDRVLVQAGQLGLVVDDHGRRSGGGHQAGVELGGEGGLFHVELAQARLVGVGQLCASAHQAVVVMLDQALLHRVQLQRVTLVVQRLHAGEQLRVEVDFVLVRGQLRGDVFLDLLARFGAIGLDQAEEDARHAVQGLAAALHRHDGVVEGGRLGVVGDLADVGQVLAHAFFEGRRVVAVLDLVELRRLERQRAGAQQRVGGGFGRLLGRGFLCFGHGGGLLAGTGRQRQADGGGQDYGTRHVKRSLGGRYGIPALHPTPVAHDRHVPDVAPRLPAVAGSDRAAGLAHPGPVELTDGGHVGGIIAGRLEQRADADGLFRVVEIGGQDRHVGHPGDLQEAGLPVLHGLAGAFGGDGEPHLLVVAQQVHGLADGALRRAAVQRDHAQLVQQRAQRPPEQRGLAQHLHLHAQRDLGRHPPQTVPVGRMRGDDEDHLGNVGQGADHLPAPHTQGAACQPAQEGVGFDLRHLRRHGRQQ